MTFRLSSGIVAVLALSLLSAPAAAQQSLSPFRDPFSAPTSRTPEFFKDEMDLAAEDSIIAAFDKDAEVLRKRLSFIRERDHAFEQRGSRRSGLALPLMELLMGFSETPDEVKRLRDQALEEAADKNEKEQIRARGRQSELEAASRWLWKGSVNRWGRIFNHFIKALNPTSLLTGSFVGPVVDSTLGFLWDGVRSEDITDEERRALVLYLDAIARDPEAEIDNRLSARIEKLIEKKKSAVLGTSVELGESQLKAGDLTMAEFHFRRALDIDEESASALKGIEKVQKEQTKREEDRRAALSVAEAKADVPQPGVAESEQEEIIEALTDRQPERVLALAQSFTTAHPSSAMRSQIEATKAVALEMQGKRAEAIHLLNGIARDKQDEGTSKKALLLATSPEYNSLASFERARTTYRNQTIKFVLGGDDFVRNNLAFGVSPFLAQGAAAAGSLGAVTLFRAAGNLVHVFVGNPISRQPMIREGERFLRENPNSPELGRVHRFLASAYAKEKIYDRALYHEEVSGAKEAELKDLREKAAEGLLAYADQELDRERKETYLVLLLKTYPGTEAAKRGAKTLRKITLEANQGLRLSKKFLVEHPELTGPDGLNLKSSLFDNALQNGEVAEDGIVIHNGTELTVYFSERDRSREQRFFLPENALDRVFALLREIRYQKALDLYIKGGGEVSAPFVTAGLKEFTVGSSPVVDYEFVSDKEEKNRAEVAGGPFGTNLAFSTDGGGPRGSLGLPIPVLRDWIPVDFLFQGGPGSFLLVPQVGGFQKQGDHSGLFR